MKLIKQIFENSKKRYGAPRVYQAIIAQGAKIAQSTVSQWMKESGYRAKMKTKFKVVTTDSNHKLPVATNVLNRDVMVRGPGAVLFSDIT